ncbi:MAG: hypothetical protein EHM41_00215 [Chloroflexi bacterium]|nr:MAG: hypothetical protein EHM41_00215 [Chloroflexota bacterium]
MSICWYCYWGWSKPVADIYTRALIKLDGDESALHYGPAHVVWEDENWDCAEDCLKDFDQYTNTNHTNEEWEIVRDSLKELIQISIEIRDPEPEEYDGEHPEQYPPAPGIEMVRL